MGRLWTWALVAVVTVLLMPGVGLPRKPPSVEPSPTPHRAFFPEWSCERCTKRRALSLKPSPMTAASFEFQ